MTGVSSIASTAKGRAGLCTVDGLRRMTGITENLINELQLLLGVARRTLQRWRNWWRKIFVEAPFRESGRVRFAANRVKLLANKLT